MHSSFGFHSAPHPLRRFSVRGARGCASVGGARALVSGVMQVMMVTPIGERVEKFPFDQQGLTTDPDGRSFRVDNRWEAGSEGSALVSTATDDGKDDNVFVTSRHIDSSTGQLVQVTSHDGLSFTRYYDRRS